MLVQRRDSGLLEVMLAQDPSIPSVSVHSNGERGQFGAYRELPPAMQPSDKPSPNGTIDTEEGRLFVGRAYEEIKNIARHAENVTHQL